MADKPTSSASLKPSNFNNQQSIQSVSASTPSRTMGQNTIAPIVPSKESGVKKILDISNLMSPPELPRMESFSPSIEAKAVALAVSNARRTGQTQTLSPPISPATKVDDHPTNVAMSVTAPVSDPILYPSHDVAGSPQQRPLFAQDESMDVHRIVDEHINTRPTEPFKATAPPKREDYELVLHFRSHVYKKYNENPKSWLRRERGFLLADRRAGARNNQVKIQPKAILPAKPQQPRKETQRAKTTKPVKVTKATQSHATAPRPIRSYPIVGAGQASNRPPSATPDPSPRRAVAPNREDKDFGSIPDFCPPLNSLPEKTNSLKVDWKGTPIDLSNDQHRQLLHPDEVALAANLRLDCATYLTSKRRMFVRRRECLGMGKEFRKTDAQQACKIDVNKASKLWTAFEKVGWLDKKWMADLV
ncbi:hypothetical protein F5Y04DRAFT_202036 [Hypomontagnella monticulosa]|nr:hypothetical protein F5Y04DRAFT_202036 [Hypomontagnella monticulosa]